MQRLIGTGESVGPTGAFMALGFADLAEMISIIRAAGSVPALNQRGGSSWLPVQ